jgi:hypothetical protein
MSSTKWQKMAEKSLGKSEGYRGYLRKIMLDRCRKVWYMFRFWCRKMRRFAEKKLDKAMNIW